jgi:iron complex outermembrane recepter protein
MIQYLLASALAAAADPAAAPDAAPQEVIVTGTRRTERTAVDSSVPVDVLSKDDLHRIVSHDLNNKLQSLVPSYSVKRLPLSDGAIFVRPAALRNLSPDQTLVLVNGKRWHRSAFVDVTARGSQAVDLSQIPQSAIKRVEVLRDGASAQYGSDAIAGVINFILDDQPGANGFGQFGEYSEGDGRNLQAGLGTGFAIGDRAKINLSFEYINADATSRSVQRPQAAALIALGEPYSSTVDQPVVQRFGQPDIENYRFFYNSSVTVNDALEGYAFGNYAHSFGENDFNWRAPAAAGGFSQSSAFNRSRFQDGANALYPGWDLRSIFPGGFTPRFGSTQDDYSTVLGVKGEITPGLSWDFSGSYGHNTIEYQLRETINASLGPLSPTSFDAGSREQTETNVNLDFVYRWDTILEAPVNVAFGAEYRREEFAISAGDEASYVVGPLRDLASGSNGFPGASPNQAGTWANSNTAAYVDLDADITSRWNVGIAGRFEDYSSFGSTTNGKLSTRFKLTDDVNLRAAVSTGFRAPTPGQENLTNTGQFPDAVTAIVRTRGTIPATSPGALLLGAAPLEPEQSDNYSLGVVLTPLDNFTVSVDAYRIDIDDRILLSQDFILTDAQRAVLVAAGVSGASDLFQVNFFTNGFETKTQGVDVVLAYRTALGAGNLSITSAYNHNKTEVTNSDPGVVSLQTRSGVEQALPRDTANLTADYNWRQWSFFARARYYGGWLWQASTTDASTNQLVGSEAFFDLASTYAATDNVSVTLGVEDIFDNYSDKALFNTFVGRVYPSGTPYENDGRQAYVRVGIRF